MTETIAILHPGQMGAAVATQLHQAGRTVLWCPTGRSVATGDRAHESGLEPVEEFAELLARSSIVLAICPPASAEEVAEQVATAGFDGVYVDANAINPDRMGRITEELAAATVVDASIIGPPPDEQKGARIYLAGPAEAASRIAASFENTHVDPVRLTEEIGKASALKMAFASFQKAGRALAAVAHGLADDHGVTDALLAEADRMSGRHLADRDYIPSVAARAWRWQPEMREIADTLTASGLPSELAEATQAVYERLLADKDQRDMPVEAVLDHLHR